MKSGQETIYIAVDWLGWWLFSKLLRRIFKNKNNNSFNNHQFFNNHQWVSLLSLLSLFFLLVLQLLVVPFLTFSYLDVFFFSLYIFSEEKQINKKHKDIKTEARKLSGTWKESIDQNQGGCWGHGGLSERRANNNDKRLIWLRFC